MQLHLNKRFEWKELPDMQFFRSEIDRNAKDITIGETLFFKEHGVKTEGEYKKKAMAEGFITKHSHIGWNSWDETAKNLEYIYEELTRRGYTVELIGVDGQGKLDMAALQNAVDENTAIVSAMWGNNETGTIFPVKRSPPLPMPKGRCFIPTQCRPPVK